MRTRRHAGFTLIEAIVTLAVIGIAATIALPEFNRLLAGRRLVGATDDLYATLFYARSEAIRLNQSVVVQPIGGDWSNGWEVPDPVHGGVFLAKHAQTGITVAEADGAVAITYLASGRLPPGPTPTFSLCDVNKNAKQRELTIDLSGLPNVTVKDACP